VEGRGLGDLAGAEDKWRVVVNAVMNRRISQRSEEVFLYASWSYIVLLSLAEFSSACGWIASCWRHLGICFYVFEGTNIRPNLRKVTAALRISAVFHTKLLGLKIWCGFDRASSLICGNKMPTRCNWGFLLQILLLVQHVSGTTMPMIRSSRVLYGGCCLWYFVLWFSSCWSGVELRVMCPVCRMLQHQNPVHPSPFPHTCHMPRPSHSSRFYHPHNIR